jgi:nitrite reductase/ring-hydroxylating ferredoxin subunit
MTEYVRFIKVGVLPAGKAAVKMINGIPIYVVNVNGDFKAYVAVCPHKFHILCNRQLLDNRIVCPGHGENYDPDNGEPIKGLSKILLKNIRLKILDGEIYVEKPEEELTNWLRNLTGAQ